MCDDGAESLSDDFRRLWSAFALSEAGVVQPLFILAGGAVSAAVGVRTTLLVAAVGLMATSTLLPWTSTRNAADGVDLSEGALADDPARNG